MRLLSNSLLVTCLFRRVSRSAAIVGAATAVLVLPASAVHSQQAHGSDQSSKNPVVEFTVDVAEDLNGKFVPTFVKPEHTQPERGSLFRD